MGGQPHAPAASTPGKDPVPIVQEAGCASGRAENVVPTGIRPRDSPLTLCNFDSYQKGAHYAGIKIFNLLPTQIKCVANEIEGFKNNSKRVLLDKRPTKRVRTCHIREGEWVRLILKQSAIALIKTSTAQSHAEVKPEQQVAGGGSNHVQMCRT